MLHINNEFSNINVARTIRFTETLYHELTNVANANDVSFNMLVLQCCRYALDHLEQEDGKGSE